MIAGHRPRGIAVIRRVMVAYGSQSFLQRLHQCRHVRRGPQIGWRGELPYRVGAAVVTAAPLTLCLMLACADDTPARLIFSQFWLRACHRQKCVTRPPYFVVAACVAELALAHIH